MQPPVFWWTTKKWMSVHVFYSFKLHFFVQAYIFFNLHYLKRIGFFLFFFTVCPSVYKTPSERPESLMARICSLAFNPQCAFVTYFVPLNAILVLRNGEKNSKFHTFISFMTLIFNISSNWGGCQERGINTLS